MKNNMDGLAEKIRAGISKHGCHVLHREDLETFWCSRPDLDEERQLMVKNFASHYGFLVHVSPYQMLAVFLNACIPAQ